MEQATEESAIWEWHCTPSFNWDAPGHISRACRMCGRDYSGEEDDGYLVRWEKAHVPTDDGRMCKAEEAYLRALRSADENPSTSGLTHRVLGRQYEQGDLWEGLVIVRCVPSSVGPGFYDAWLAEKTPKSVKRYNAWRTDRLETENKEHAERKRVAILSAEQFLAEVRSDLQATGEEWLAADECVADAMVHMHRGKAAYIEHLRACANATERDAAMDELRNTPSVSALERCLACMVKSGLESESSHQQEDLIRHAVLAAIAKGHPDSAELARLALTTSEMGFDRWYS